MAVAHTALADVGFHNNVTGGAPIGVTVVAIVLAFVP